MKITEKETAGYRVEKIGGEPVGEKYDREKLESLARLIRYYILTSTTAAGSGHPTSSLSAVEMTAGLMFSGIFRYDADNPDHPNNDRLIFSKGHASPLFYSLWAAAGRVSEAELMTLRKIGSPLEGHPTPDFRYADAATGSLGQGLSIGVGMALNAKYVDKLPYTTYVLLGDSEMAEGSQWEAMQIASYYHLNNLVGILDVNRLGQRGETMYGHDLSAYEDRIAAFGWETISIDGHDFDEVIGAFRGARESGKPVMIIGRTVKGKGVSFIENLNGWHGKTLNEEQLKRALDEMGPVDKSVRGTITGPPDLKAEYEAPGKRKEISYDIGSMVATRKAYGVALERIRGLFPRMVVLDGEVDNSTYAEIFKKAYPDRFFEMYVAEQNMVGAALGFARRNKIPFVSTFAAFFSRAFDQIRMSRYSGNANIKFAGSHAGVSIGQDGPSQMGLEDIALFRSILDSVVLYPSDAVSTEKLVEEAARREGLVYIRTTRGETPVIYRNDEEFPLGECKVLRSSDKDVVTIVAAGITIHEALKACEVLKKEGLAVRVIDLYCIKPINREAFSRAVGKPKAVLTVEDHYAEGGIGEAVRSALEGIPIPVYSLAVRKMPKSGSPDELLAYEEISHDAIVEKIRRLA